MDHNVFIGILLWWDFESVRYIEHLAVVPTLRGMQHGERILRHFLSESDMPVWLEVEPPDNELRNRRVGFYRRVGFTLNEHDYTQPAYEKSSQPVPLLVMTYPEAITEPDIRFFCRQYHPLLTDYSLAGA
jgi:acetyltransferase, GNAT family